jgi:hypothetical protein
MGGLILLIAVAVAADVDSAHEVQIITIDGTVSASHIEDLSGKWLSSNSILAKKTVNQILSILPAHQLSPPAQKPTAWIELIDGSKLTVNEFNIEAGIAELSFDSTTAKLSLSSIRNVRFAQPEGVGTSSSWPASSDPKSDLLVIQKKDQLDFMEGSIGNVDENHVILKVDGENYPVKRSKVAGLIFFHKNIDTPSAPLCIVETSNGWKLKAKQFAFDMGSTPGAPAQIGITTVFDDTLTIPWELVSKIDFSPGKIAYLSDLEPASMQWTPYFDFGQSAPTMADFYAPRRDEGREHQSLLLGGKKYDKGLALCSRTAIDFRIPEGMKKFKATAGIDDAVRETGNVRLKILADGKNLFDQAITGKATPTDLNLDLDGAKRLSILVDFGDGFDAGDYLDLAEARMVK